MAAATMISAEMFEVMAPVLYLSRVFGLQPLKWKRGDYNYVIEKSHAYVAYSNIVVVFFGTQTPTFALNPPTFFSECEHIWLIASVPTGPDLLNPNWQQHPPLRHVFGRRGGFNPFGTLCGDYIPENRQVRQIFRLLKKSTTCV